MIEFNRIFTINHVEFTTAKNKGWTNVSCVFCSDHSNALGFNNEDGHCTCFKCGHHHTDEALAKVLNVNEVVARQILSEFSNGVTIRDVRKSKGKNLKLPSSGFTEREIAYLKSRRFVPSQVAKFGVCGGGMFGKWSFRIIIPLYYKGMLVSWTARSIYSKKFCEENEINRYKNLSIEESVINPKHCLYNIDNVKGDEVFLVEGPMDCLRLATYDVPSVCCWGSSITEEQKVLLFKNFNKIHILFDNDETGFYKAESLQKDLEALGLEVDVMNGLIKKFGKNDPAEFGYRECEQLKGLLS